MSDVENGQGCVFFNTSDVLWCSGFGLWNKFLLACNKTEEKYSKLWLEQRRCKETDTTCLLQLQSVRVFPFIKRLFFFLIPMFSQADTCCLRHTADRFLEECLLLRPERLDHWIQFCFVAAILMHHNYS